MTWRVTVRQLESLIRLSEAFAKLQCLEEITVDNVEEARRLLSKSIVRVEQPDIDFNEDEAAQNMHMDNEEFVEGGNNTNSLINDNNVDQPASSSKILLSIKLEIFLHNVRSEKFF